MKQIYKSYQQPFLLERTKLDRLLDIVHSRLGDHEHTTKRDHFEVLLLGNRRDEMSSVDDLFKLDNSPRSKIRRLLITGCASTDGNPAHEIQVDFDGRNVDKNKTKIVVVVRSDNAAWADVTLAQLEEQIERTSLHDNHHRTWLPLIMIFLALVLLYLVGSSMRPGRSGADAAGVMWLRGSDLDRVEQILKSSNTISDVEMREVVTKQLRNVLEHERPTQPAFSGWTRQKSFIAIPVVIVFVYASYLLAVCYPSAVFLWGDEDDHYKRILQRRRVGWQIIGGVAVIGVLSKILTMGLFP
jgi:hypothetical protein